MSLPVEITGKESPAGDGSPLDALIDFYRSFNASDLKALEHEWQLDGPDGATASITHRPRFATEDMMALRLAALRGIGVCQAPTLVVAEGLNSRRPVDPVPGWLPQAGIIHTR